MKIAICGSMAFSPEMLKLAEELKKRGYETEMPAFTEHYARLDTKEQMHVESAQNKIKYDLIRKYWELIKEADAVLIANYSRKGIENYIGANTLIEMAFAHVLEKPIYLLNSIPQQDSTDEIIAMHPRVIEGDLARIASE